MKIHVRVHKLNVTSCISWVAYFAQWYKQGKRPTYVHCSLAITSDKGEQWDYHYSVGGVTCYPGNVCAKGCEFIPIKPVWSDEDVLEYILYRSNVDKGSDYRDLLALLNSQSDARTCVTFVLKALGYTVNQYSPQTCDQLYQRFENCKDLFT